MKEQELLAFEKDNYTTIHLHLVGMFWKAYQRSALGFHKEIKAYKIIIRRNKRQHTTVAFLGFPADSLNETLKGHNYIRESDTHIVAEIQAKINKVL